MGRVAIVLLLALGASAPADEDARTQAEAHRARGEALAGESKLDEARVEYEKARARFEEAKDRASAAAMLGKAAGILVQQQAYAEAADAWRRYAEEQSAIHGTDHPNTGMGLTNAAVCLQSLGRPAEALPLVEQALAIHRRIHPADHGSVAASLNGIAVCLQGLGRYAEALPLMEESVAMTRRLFPGDHPTVALAMLNLAAALRDVGRVTDAMSLAEESLVMYRRLFPGDHAQLAACLNAVAVGRASLGRPVDALPLAEESLAMYRRLSAGDHPSVAEGLTTIARCLRQVGRAGDALRAAEEGLAIRRRLFPGDHPAHWWSIGEAGGCLEELGRPSEALPLYEDALAMLRRLHPYDHGKVEMALMSVAGCLVRLGRPAEALSFAEDGLAMARRLFPGDHTEVAASLAMTAVCLDHLGRTGDALRRFEESLAMYRRLLPGDHADVATSLYNVATCLRRIGRAADALRLTEESLAMYRRLFPGDHPQVATALSAVATCQGDLGRAEVTLALSEESLAMTRRLLAGDHPDVARCLCNVGSTMHELGRLAEAQVFLEESVAMSRRLGTAERHVPLVHTARLRIERGDRAGALELLREAVDHVESLRGRALGLDEGDRALYFASLKQTRAYDVIARTLRECGDDAEALRYLERARARSLLDLLDRSRLDPVAEVRAQAAERGQTELLATIDEASGALARAAADVGRLTYELAALRPTGSESEQRQAAIRKASGDLAAARRAEQEILRRRARLIGGQLRVAQPADAAALQRLAGPDGRVLVYSVSEEGTTLFVVPPAGTAIRALDLAWQDGARLTAKSLVEKIEEHARRVATGRAGARGVTGLETQGRSWDAGDALFRALVPTGVWADVRKAKIVHIVADGALQRVAFESLPVGDGFWIDAGPPVVYGPSGSALLWGREQGDRQRSQGRLDEVVVLGDPVFARDAAAPPVGVVVVAVTADGQAKRLGIEPGDVIVAYGGKEIAAAEALGGAIREGSREPSVALWRGGVRRDVRVAPGPLGVQLSREPVPDALQRLRAMDPVVMRASAEQSGALSRYGELAPLPGTRREAEAIAKALGSPGPPPIKVTLLLGEDATAPNLRRAAPRARYLHIATHGLSDETEFASYSSLALTLPRTPTAEDDGFLSLADVLAGWRGALARCELVVLSACETQRGFEQRDEGVYALPVGFLYAGAPSVIGSLWRVDDASTAELFADFYARLRGSGGREKLVAFTEARKALKKKHPEPYFWAPFVYVGDPR